MKRVSFVFVLNLMLMGFVLASEGQFSWDFSDCEIKDILFAVSLDTGISVTCDDTVSGKADFKFAGKDFDVAFDSFLKGNRLFVVKNNDVWVVSRFSFVEKDSENLELNVYDLAPVMIMEKLSLCLNQSLTFETLPVGRISVHFKGLNLEELLKALSLRFGNYEVEKTEQGFHFVKRIENVKVDSSDSFLKVTLKDEKVNVDVKNCKFSEVVEKVFEVARPENRSFCFAAGSDVKVLRACFMALDVEEILKKLCGQNGFAFEVLDGIYYFFAESNVREEFLFGEKYWNFFKLKYIPAKEVFPLILNQLGKIDYTTFSDDFVFFAKTNQMEKEKIEEIIRLVDIQQAVYVVNLKYIRPVELMEHLPPSVDKSALFLADDNSCIYFKGTQEAYEALCDQIQICDRSETRIIYDLLIIQYDETEQNTWSSSFGTSKIRFGERNNFSGQLGSVLNLNVNVVSAFGIGFAASLQSSIEKNNAWVFADTTLHGVSGKNISFQNTNTYRYRDNNLDPETGKPIYSGITREITSGIRLEILPWVSGEGMITSTVKASISRQGIDTSSSTGNPPPTTEKIVTTEVVCKSGEPVVLSGLIQSSLNEGQKNPELAARIPVIKKILGNSEKNKESSQMVIILVPRIEGLISENEFYSKKDFEKTIEEIKQILLQEEKND